MQRQQDAYISEGFVGVEDVFLHLLKVRHGFVELIELLVELR